MSNILALEPIAEPERPVARRVRRLSRSLAFCFTGLVAIYALLMALLTVIALFFGTQVHAGAEATAITWGASEAIAGTTRLSDLPLLTRIAAVTSVLLAMAPVLLILWHLRGLFSLYAAGIVFARENARHLKHAGIALAAFPFVKFAASMIFRVAGGPDQVWFRPGLLLALVAGAVIFVIAQVMEFGHEIEEEKDSFI
jgi:hypothetical protein